MAKEPDWVLPGTDAISTWVKVEGTTQGGMESDAEFLITSGLEGVSTEGSLSASTKFTSAVGTEGTSTTGSASSAAGVTVAAGSEGPTTAGHSESPTKAEAAAGSEGPTSVGAGRVPTETERTKGTEGTATVGQTKSKTEWPRNTGKHLKPTHRWQMPLPRNLLDDPESFDPANTVWNAMSNTVYGGTVANVGPNGEAAHHFDRSGETTDDYLLGTKDFPSGWDYGVASQGLFVRAVNGSGDIRLDHNTFDGLYDTTLTLDTSWAWVKLENFPAAGNGSGQIAEFRVRDLGVREVYVLRAGVNWGASFHYSTRSAVPQEIPDVIQGADLQNGSSSGADTNDLDFAVDGETVPYAVADGDDETSTLPQDGTETWAVRVYIPASVGADVQYLGDSALGYPTLIYDDANGDLRVRYKDSGGTTQQGPRVSAAEGQWHSVAVTVDGSDLRLNVGGTTDEQTGTDLSITADPRLLGSAAGARVQHLEHHPVLTPAEAEAVRQRLASNPSDPVPRTEAWDLTSETSPHNLVTQSEDISSADWTKTNATVTADATNDPNGNATADALIEDSSTAQHFIQQAGPTLAAGAQYVFPIWIQDNGRTWAKIALSGAAFTTNPEAWVDLSGNAIGTTTAVDSADVTEVGGGWHRAWILVTADNADASNVEVYIADADGSDSYAGDGASGIYVWGAQFVRGDDTPPPYVATTTSIAYPQTVPALRQSSNDLTLGSSSGADTNDPSWVAPIGLIGDGGDDQLYHPSFHNNRSATWIATLSEPNGSAIFYGANSKNGWGTRIKGGGVRLLVRDVNGDLLDPFTSYSFIDLTTPTPVAIRLDVINQVMKFYVLNELSPRATLDFSDLGKLPTGEWQIGMYVNNVHIYQSVGYNRLLTEHETLYARQRILDNPEQPFPNYTTP